MSDIIIINHGSICLMVPKTEAGKEWLDNHIDPDHLTFGQNTIVVEPRYLGPIVDGASDDGITMGWVG